MRNYGYFFNIFVLYLLLIAALPVFAAEKIVFNQSISKKSQKLIHDYAHHALDMSADTLNIAQVDLNEDGLDEFIIRKRWCTLERQMCLFVILAEANGEILSLGEITAQKLALGNSYSGGVRSILAFKNQASDFDYKVYVWEPGLSKYILTE